mmetsp:Transcript_7486/g.21328  ORF Transcript_7486/g.21328 Transcript_7486/m.21328 type:complete len:485 (-) Transcript_7486:1148-2602(-)
MERADSARGHFVVERAGAGRPPHPLGVPHLHGLDLLLCGVPLLDAASLRPRLREDGSCAAQPAVQHDRPVQREDASDAPEDSALHHRREGFREHAEERAGGVFVAARAVHRLARVLRRGPRLRLPHRHRLRLCLRPLRRPQHEDHLGDVQGVPDLGLHHRGGLPLLGLQSHLECHRQLSASVAHRQEHHWLVHFGLRAGGRGVLVLPHLARRPRALRAEPVRPPLPGAGRARGAASHGGRKHLRGQRAHTGAGLHHVPYVAGAPLLAGAAQLVLGHHLGQGLRDRHRGRRLRRHPLHAQRAAGVDERRPRAPGLLRDHGRGVVGRSRPLPLAAGAGRAGLPLRRCRARRQGRGGLGQSAGLLDRGRHLHLDLLAVETLRLRNTANLLRRGPRQPALGAPDHRGAQKLHPRHRVRPAAAGLLLRQGHHPHGRAGLAHLGARGGVKVVGRAVRNRHHAYPDLHRAVVAHGQLLLQEERRRDLEECR